MKVSALISPAAVEPTSSRAKRAPGRNEAGGEVSVKLSGDARWTQDVRNAASQLQEFLPEEVDRAKADIADGSLEAAADWEEVLDAMLAEI